MGSKQKITFTKAIGYSADTLAKKKKALKEEVDKKAADLKILKASLKNITLLYRILW